MTAFLRQVLEGGKTCDYEMCSAICQAVQCCFATSRTTGESAAEWQLDWSAFCSNSHPAPAKYRSGVIWLAFEHCDVHQ